MLENRQRFVFVIILVSIILIGANFLRKPKNPPVSKDLKAAIIDGLSEEFPNPDFIADASGILASGGYEVDYYNSSKVTVEMYKTLPEKGYDLIILRIHSAPMDGNNPGAAFFTTESQQGLYFTEQFLGWVRRARTLTRGDRYYAVTPGFFVEGMKGSFNDTIILTMSCYGSVDDTLANIFIGRGAKAYLGWDEKVTANHMDEITHFLLEEYVTNEKTLQEAVTYVMEEYGEDPFYNSQLILFYEN
jgi:hypothetical protein